MRVTVRSTNVPTGLVTDAIGQVYPDVAALVRGSEEGAVLLLAQNANGSAYPSWGDLGDDTQRVGFVWQLGTVALADAIRRWPYLPLADEPTGIRCVVAIDGLQAALTWLVAT